MPEGPAHEGSSRLLTLPHEVLQHVIGLLDEDTHKALFATCKALACLVLSNCTKASPPRPMFGQGGALNPKRNLSSAARILEWATQCVPGKLCLFIMEHHARLYELCKAGTGGCLAGITRLTISGHYQLEGLLPEQLVAGLPNLTHLEYFSCKLRTLPPPEPVHTSLAVKLQHLRLGLLPNSPQNPNQFSIQELLHIQQLHQLNSLTSLELHCIHGMLSALSLRLPGQLTALCMTLDNGQRAVGDSMVQPATWFVQQCTSLRKLVMEDFAVDVTALLQLPSPLAHLTYLDLLDMQLPEPVALTLLRLPDLKTLKAGGLLLGHPYTQATPVRELAVGYVTMQQLSYLPLRQLERPLGVRVLCYTSDPVHQQLAWAAAAADNLRAGPGTTQVYSGSNFPVIELRATDAQGLAPGEVLQLVAACAPFAPKSAWWLQITGMRIDAATLRAVQKLCPKGTSLGFGELCRFHASWPAALADCWPGLNCLIFHCDVDSFGLCSYIYECEKRVEQGRSHPAQRIMEFHTPQEGPPSSWTVHKVKQTSAYLTHCGIKRYSLLPSFDDEDPQALADHVDLVETNTEEEDQEEDEGEDADE